MPGLVGKKPGSAMRGDTQCQPQATYMYPPTFEYVYKHIHTTYIHMPKIKTNISSYSDHTVDKIP